MGRLRRGSLSGWREVKLVKLVWLWCPRMGIDLIGGTA